MSDWNGRHILSQQPLLRFPKPGFLMPDPTPRPGNSREFKRQFAEQLIKADNGELQKTAELLTYQRRDAVQAALKQFGLTLPERVQAHVVENPNNAAWVFINKQRDIFFSKEHTFHTAVRLGLSLKNALQENVDHELGHVGMLHSPNLHRNSMEGWKLWRKMAAGKNVSDAERSWAEAISAFDEGVAEAVRLASPLLSSARAERHDQWQHREGRTFVRRVLGDEEIGGKGLIRLLNGAMEWPTLLPHVEHPANAEPRFEAYEVWRERTGHHLLAAVEPIKAIPLSDGRSVLGKGRGVYSAEHKAGNSKPNEGVMAGIHLVKLPDGGHAMAKGRGGRRSS